MIGGAPKFPSKPGALESEANYEGNDALLLIGRVRNPIIRDQILKLLRVENEKKLDALRTEEWELDTLGGFDKERKLNLVKGKKTGKIIKAPDLEDQITKLEKDRDLIAEYFDSRVEEAERFTPIEFSQNQPSEERMTTDWELPWLKKKATSKQMSIIEAHEKGHLVRPYGEELREFFMPAFDLSKVEFTDAYYEMLKLDSEKERAHRGLEEAEYHFPSKEVMREDYLNDSLFYPAEIAERMSQLKNYFGIAGAEQFTKEHLSYARAHYISDTGIDNGMTLFFEAITPETEDAFIVLINGAGI